MYTGDFYGNFYGCVGRAMKIKVYNLINVR